MASKVVMRCVSPVHDADGVVVYQPGDELPEGSPKIDECPVGSWAPFIAADDVAEPAVPEPEPEPVPEVAAPAVDF